MPCGLATANHDISNHKLSAMALQRAARLWAIIAIAIALQLCSMATAAGPPSIPLAYCASANTGDLGPFESIYQSEGRCFGNCTDAGYALAIVQAHNCWCSNVVPASGSEKPLTDCHDTCPGYPDDFCGGSGTFGYLAIKGKTPSSTGVSSGDDTSSSTTAPPPSSTSSSTAKSTVTLPPPAPVIVVSTSSSASVASSTALLSQDTPPDTNTSPGVTSVQPIVQTVTVEGTVRTITATPSPTGTSPAAVGSPTVSTNHGLATGAAVGIAVGVIGAVAIIGIFFWMWWWKRKRQNGTAERPYGSPSIRGSSSGMMVSPKMAEVTETQFVGPDGRTGVANWDQNASAKRRSHLMPIDPRLDPFAKGIYANNQNKSHESVGSLQDNHDYSRRVHQPKRVLRAMNPDPDHD
ncbi:hypothetical protein B0T17DRAFT_597956 [Bombardia bombarda]|uniref:WSC domain-containing protein n=1 Tax=Bombardia bombarda TaxID=252184 RepID=A0AA40C9W4_9PEZI|nr:hypothetical protein B0T17DRAFT_597956 [Bombardia bombarda]